MRRSGAGVRLVAVATVSLAASAAVALPRDAADLAGSAPAARPPAGARLLAAVPRQRLGTDPLTRFPALPASLTGGSAVRPPSAGVPRPGAVPTARRPADLAAAAGCPARPGALVQDAPGSGRTVALTFDDGPSEWTPAVLDVLAREHVHATFFVIGRSAQADPATLRRIAAEGHQLGNHSWSHRYPRDVRGGWTRAYLRDELARTDAVVARVIGRPPCWFRPPGGFLTAVPASAKTARKTVALWSVDTLDWQEQPEGTTADPGARRQRTITRRADAGATLPHPVVLMHDGGGWRAATMRSLPAVIAYYRARGYRFVRLDGRP
jgi:peptidoglycan/xylan/chitin deacetylase (PgdA/CDA1 family)